MTLTDLPPAIVKAAEADPRLNFIRQANGVPVFKTFSKVTRLVGIVWEDGAGFQGWTPCPAGYWRPDLRTAEGQEWQRMIDGITYPNTYEGSAYAKQLH